VELHLYSINQNGELKKNVKEDGAETRMILVEFREEMAGKITELLDNFRPSSNSDASGRQEGTVAEHGVLRASQVRTSGRHYRPISYSNSI
jgi:hypothetical protein